MTIVNAFADGMRRVTRAPAVLLGVMLITFLVALLLGGALHGMISASLGHSAAAESAAAAVNNDWWQEFSARAEGVGSAFRPTTIGFGGVLDNLSSVLDNTPHTPAVAGAGAAYLLVWVFLVGGILDRYARDRRLRAAGFFSACGVYFFRFLRLGVIALAAYALAYGLHSWLFGSFYPWATRDLTAERSAFLVRLALYLVFGGLLVGINLLLDYAKIRAVVEDRRSMIGALLAAVRFVRRRPVETSGLYLLNGGLFLVLLLVYSLVAPGAGGAGVTLWVGLLVTQIYLLLRLWVKLVFYASQVSLFQASLAHAGYAAAPVHAWPESPAAEAITPPAPPPQTRGE